MDHYIDVSDEIFDALQSHSTDILPLSLTEGADYQLGDSLKLYHPSNPHEALRVQIDKIDKKEENDAELLLHCSLLEWIFQIETELDQMLREEEALLADFF